MRQKYTLKNLNKTFESFEDLFRFKSDLNMNITMVLNALSQAFLVKRLILPLK